MGPYLGTRRTDEDSNTELQKKLSGKVWAMIVSFIGTLGAGWLSMSDSLIGNKNFYGVQVMNLVYNKNDSNAQDQLVRVPEPATMMLLGTAMFGLAIISRKKLFKK